MISTTTIEETTTVSISTISQPESTAVSTRTTGETSTSPLEMTSTAETTAITSSTRVEETTPPPLPTTTLLRTTAAATSSTSETSTAALETSSPKETTAVTGTTAVGETTTITLPTTSPYESKVIATSSIPETSTSPVETTSAAQTTEIPSTSTAEETTTVPFPTASLPGITASTTSVIQKTPTALRETTSLAETAAKANATALEETSTVAFPTTSLPESTTVASSLIREISTSARESTSLAETTVITTTTTAEETTTAALPTTSTHKSTAITTSTRAETFTSPLQTGPSEMTAGTTATLAFPTTSPVETTTTLAITTPAPADTSLTETATGVTSILPLTSTVRLETVLSAEPTRIPSASTEVETTTAALLVTYPTATTSAVTSSLAETATVAVTVTSPAETTGTLTPTTAGRKTSTSALETSSPAEIPAALGTTTEWGTLTASPVTAVLAGTTKTSPTATAAERSTAAPITTTPAETTTTYTSTTRQGTTTPALFTTSPAETTTALGVPIRGATTAAISVTTITSLSPTTAALTTVLPTSTPAPAIEHFTVNFTITNLRYDSELGSPHSTRFNATEKVLISLLNPIFENSSIGPAYIRCEVTAYRPVRAGNGTGVDAICTHRRDSTAPPFDRVGVYHEISNKTNGITTLGPYTLDKDSLCVNGYNEAPALPTVLPTSTPAPAIEHFTVNFTITNLRYDSELGSPHSTRFNATEKVLISLLNPIFENSSIGPAYIRCEVTAYRPVRAGNGTRVDAICTYRRDSTAPPFDRVGVYHEISNKTNGITTLGPYTLDKDSLCVNALSLTSPQSPTAVHFTLNFTLTNLRYTTAMGTPGSLKFNSTEKTILYYIEPLLRNSSIGPVYTGCKAMAFRSVNNRDTRIDAVCSYKNNPAVATFDRVTLYHELSGMTKGITKLGPYILESNSLYVNGFRLSDIATTTKPPPTVAPENVGYLLNFKIINVNLTNTDPKSLAYQLLQKDIADKINQLYKKSKLQGRFLFCSVTGLRIGSVVVDCQCYFKSAPNRSEETVLSTFQDGTKNASAQWLGDRYQLQGARVNVLWPVIKPVTQPPVSAEQETFRLNFTITNLFYSSELKQPNSNSHRLNKEKIEKALDNIFRNSSIQKYFTGCSVESFRPISRKMYTGINAVCKFTLDSTSRAFQREEVYEEFKRLTNGVTQLGNSYTLDKDSLLVNDYSPLNTTAGEPGRSVVEEQNQ
ncbi:Mucin-16 [Chelonia mydas]|uniref:Mucin-16 n=1 Tax=Chelonia mydas TaxID=8469 RepID=M7BNE3_CHEMY|nr:Mucin-16 [Chelonia mydas]